MKIQSILKLTMGPVVAAALVACGPGEIDSPDLVADSADVAEPDEQAPPAEPPPAIDLSNPEMRSVDADGNDESDLVILNRILDQAMVADTLDATIGADGAPTSQKSGAQITEIEDLVKLGLVKAIPPAPEGKKYVIKNGGVVLE